MSCTAPLSSYDVDSAIKETQAKRCNSCREVREENEIKFECCVALTYDGAVGGEKYYVYQRADISSLPYPRFRFSFRILASTNLKLTLYNFRVALHQKVAFNVMPARPRPHAPSLPIPGNVQPHHSRVVGARGGSSI